jgi:hypothetical protein
MYLSTDLIAGAQSPGAIVDVARQACGAVGERHSTTRQGKNRKEQAPPNQQRQAREPEAVRKKFHDLGVFGSACATLQPRLIFPKD